MATANPYDELRYPTRPIEVSAPERLALASVLHGGPRPPRAGYRVLELGCGDGGNLLPLAWYRHHSRFWGIDGARAPVAAAQQRIRALGLDDRVRVLHAGFEEADAALEPDVRFDFVLVHGVVSWVPDSARDALLRLCARRLEPGGLLYLNYNTQPGWAVRGMVRDFLLAQTAGEGGLRARAEAARAVAARLAEALDDEHGHPYRRLMASELALVRDGHVAYVAHEYLAPVNRAYWRREMMRMLGEHGLVHVADADFDQPWERGGEDFAQWLGDQGIEGRGRLDTIDLLRYRQLHSPVLTLGPWSPRPLQVAELAELTVAGCLQPRESQGDAHRLVHPISEMEVTVDDDDVAAGLQALTPSWPKGRRVSEVFADVEAVLEDLPLLHRNGLVELRLAEPDRTRERGALAELEAEDGYRTDALHRREAVARSEEPKPEPA